MIFDRPCHGLKNALASCVRSVDLQVRAWDDGGGCVDDPEGKGFEFFFALAGDQMVNDPFDGRLVQLAAMDYGVPGPDNRSQARALRDVCLGRLSLRDGDQGSHVIYEVPEKDYEHWEVLLARCQEKDAMVAMTATDNLDPTLSRGENALGRWACLCLYHDVNLEAAAYPGFCDVWRHWRFSTGLSTRDSYGIQPCNLLHRHQAKMRGY